MLMNNYYIRSLININSANGLNSDPPNTNTNLYNIGNISGNIFDGQLLGSTNNIIKGGILNLSLSYKQETDANGKSVYKTNYIGTINNLELCDLGNEQLTAKLNAVLKINEFFAVNISYFMTSINKDICTSYNKYSIDWSFLKEDIEINNNINGITLNYNRNQLYNLILDDSTLKTDRKIKFIYPYVIKNDKNKYETNALYYEIDLLNVSKSPKPKTDQYTFMITKSMVNFDSSDNPKLFSISILQEGNKFTINISKNYNYVFNIFYDTRSQKITNNYFIMNCSLTNVEISPIVSEQYSMDKQLINIETEDKMGVNNLYTRIQTKKEGMNPYLNKDLSNYLGYTKYIDYNKETKNLYHVYESVKNSPDCNVVKYIRDNIDIITSDKSVDYFDKYGQYIYKYDIYNKSEDEINNIILSLPKTYKCCVFKNLAGRVIGIYIVHKYINGNRKGDINGPLHRVLDTIQDGIIYKNNIPSGTTMIYNNIDIKDKIIKNYENNNKEYIKTAFNITYLTQETIREKIKELDKIILTSDFLEILRDEIGYIIGLYLVDIRKNKELLHNVNSYQIKNPSQINHYNDIKNKTQDEITRYMNDLSNSGKQIYKVFTNNLNNHIYTFFTD